MIKFQKILSAKTNYRSILLHTIGFLFAYFALAILIFLMFYIFLDKGFGSYENSNNRLATNLIFYFPLCFVSFIIINRIVIKVKKSLYENSKTNLLALLISLITYLLFWLN